MRGGRQEGRRREYRREEEQEEHSKKGEREQKLEKGEGIRQDGAGRDGCWIILLGTGPTNLPV